VKAKNNFGMIIKNNYTVDLNYKVKDKTWFAT